MSETSIIKKTRVFCDLYISLRSNMLRPAVDPLLNQQLRYSSCITTHVFFATSRNCRLQCLEGRIYLKYLGLTEHAVPKNIFDIISIGCFEIQFDIISSMISCSFHFIIAIIMFFIETVIYLGGVSDSGCGATMPLMANVYIQKT